MQIKPFFQRKKRMLLLFSSLRSGIHKAAAAVASASAAALFSNDGDKNADRIRRRKEEERKRKGGGIVGSLTVGLLAISVVAMVLRTLSLPLSSACKNILHPPSVRFPASKRVFPLLLHRPHILFSHMPTCMIGTEDSFPPDRISDFATKG